MVGEIRDAETGQIAIQASLTGHLVLSTLHTNDAPGAVTRLIDMGLEPFLVSASLEGVLAQRLIRTICKDCKTDYEPTDNILIQLEIPLSEIGDKHFATGEGCESCGGSGYRGRKGLYELLKINDAHNRKNCRHENATEPWACCDCDCTRKLEERLAARGGSFLEALRQS